MDARKFTIELQKIEPKQDDLIKLGLSKDAIKNIMACHICKQKKKSLSEEGDELLNLIANYDVAKLEIGMVTFFNTIQHDADYYKVGEVESDSLVLRKNTKEILVLEEFEESNILWYCAKNGSMFLDALLFCASFFNKRLFNDAFWEDRNLILTVVKESTKLAGGNKYQDFYKMLLGLYE